MKALRISLLLLLGLILTWGLWGCSEDSSTSTNPPPPPAGGNISVQIMTPTSAATYSTSSTPVTVSGTASSDNALTAVGWEVIGGANGTAAGTTSWTASVPLAALDNTVIVTATDDQGNVARDTLVVTYNSNLEFAGLRTMTPTFVLAGQSQEVRISYGIAPNVNLVADQVYLVRVDEAGNVTDTLNQMADNGDLAYGDDIGGDNNYSTIQNFNETSAGTIRLRVSAQTNTGPTTQTAYSPVFTLPAVAAPPDADVQAVLDNQTSAYAAYQGYVSSNPPDVAAQMTVDWLKTQADVQDAGLNEEKDVIWIQYDLGVDGSLYLRDPAALKGGGRASGPSVPPQLQDRGYNALRQGFGVASSDDEYAIDANTVLIYDAFYSQFPTEGDAMESLFNNADSPSFTISHPKDGACTVALVSSFVNYGVVYISTHGGVTGAGQVEFLTRESASLASFFAYLADFLTHNLGVATVGGANYISVRPGYISSLPGSMLNGIVFNSSCESYRNSTMATAFYGKGSQVYLGFSKSVHSAFAQSCATSFFNSMIDDDKTAGEAFVSGQTDPASPNAEFKFLGNDAAYFQDGLINGDFEKGDLTGWIAEGDGRVITQLGPVATYQESFMGIISTGLGYTTETGSIEQTVTFPDSVQSLNFVYDFLSEEFMEWVGSQYQDYFEVSVNGEVLYYRNIDGLAGSVTYIPIAFDQGDVYHTGWTSVSLNVSAYAGQSATILFKCGDVGDSIYDTAVLLDVIALE